ncbi:MAG TPA: DUF4149 domain-containing protein [Planctomycetota bacterium]|nr:DUF4149 domain-containing protein [Planctomycetota bacterium]
MSRAAHAVFLCSLGIWVGGMSVLGLVVAPAVFRSVPSRLQAGTIFGSVLQGFGLVQIALAVVCLGSLLGLVLTGVLPRKRGAIRIGIVALMLGLVLVSQVYLSPEIVRERESIAGFDAVPTGTPPKARFDRLHRTSVRLAATTLLLGFGLLAWSTATLKPADDGA